MLSKAGFMIHMLSGNMAPLEVFLDYHENLKCS